MFTYFKEQNADMTLHQDGNKLVDENGNKVRLLGVNCASLEWTSTPRELLRSVTVACDEWHANIIRLPVSQDRWFGFGEEQAHDPSGEKYRARVDEIVAAVACRRKYVIIDLHRSNANHWGRFVSGNHADYGSLVFWKDVALRYHNHPSVIFDLYNEPFLIDWNTWLKGGEVTLYYRDKDVGHQIMFHHDGSETTHTYVYHVPGMQKMADVVRSTGAKNILMIGGLDWAYELDGIMNGYKVIDNGGNGILLDSHLYPCKDLDRWDELVTVAANDYPIILGECGHYGEAPVKHEWPQFEESTTWVPKLLRWADEHEYHMTAWDFHHKAGPPLVLNLDDYAPTPFWGSYYKKFLAEHNK
ncbi:MAG: glycoside hydrolase family 5 protein [Ruminococcaceae bacterium]|nr:glycoside hydrolase family 5 protein [Oscillospiraceae bacterium]